MPTNRQRIEKEYTRAHAAATELLDEIGMQLQDLPAPGDDEHQVHWGDIGSLQMVCEQLTEIKRHLNSMQRR